MNISHEVLLYGAPPWQQELVCSSKYESLCVSVKEEREGETLSAVLHSCSHGRRMEQHNVTVMKIK